MHNFITQFEYDNDKEFFNDLIRTYAKHLQFGPVIDFRHNGMVCSVWYNPLGASGYGYGSPAPIHIEDADVEGTFNGYVILPDTPSYEAIDVSKIRSEEITYDSFESTHGEDLSGQGQREIGFDWMHLYDANTTKRLSDAIDACKKVADEAHDLAVQYEREAHAELEAQSDRDSKSDVRVLESLSDSYDKPIGSSDEYSFV